MPKWDGLKPLPQQIIAPLLRALACIPRTVHSRLLLRKVESGRPPGWDDNDYDVLFRGQRVGRIWCFDYTGRASGDRARYRWHWYCRDIQCRKDTEGDAPTLETAMADFRRTWDSPESNAGQSA
jgi:hypothetical protein